MEAIKRIFSGVDSSYLIKSYIISFAMTALGIYGSEGSPSIILFAIISGFFISFFSICLGFIYKINDE